MHDYTTYNVKGTTWIQRELTWEESERARALVGDFWKRVSDATQYGRFIDDLMSRGVAGELVKIILRPEGGSLLKRARARVLMRKNGVDPNDPFRSMTKSEIARAMVDFFTYSVGWMNVLTGTDANSGSSMTTENLRENISTMTKSFFDSPTATSPGQS
jgi:hypothetical protein